ncbi:MAG: hypothetical protein JWQ21_818 [Herminiimonas sp.]|nr:hypothetical protein [Herminiimonas sp.]
MKKHKNVEKSSRSSPKAEKKEVQETKGRNVKQSDGQPPVFKPLLDMALMGALALTSLFLKKSRCHWGKFIRGGQLGMLFAPRGTGKTFFILALAIAMTRKVAFLGHGPQNPRRVIILDGEMDLNSIKERLIMVARSLGVKLDDELRLFTPEIFSGLMPALTIAEGQRVIDKLIGKDWDVLFVDNYSAWSADGRETPESWAPFIRWMLTHKREGRSIIVIHHSGKNGEQRGSSKHEDALDFSISLRPVLPEAKDGSLNFQFEWRKARHLPSDQRTPFVVSLGKADSSGKRSWTRIDGAAVDPRVKQALTLKENGKTLAEIGKELNCDKSTVSRMLKFR